MPGSAWADGAHRVPKTRANAIDRLFFIDLKNDITDPE
jgi:hypothetical protein